MDDNYFKSIDFRIKDIFKTLKNSNLNNEEHIGAIHGLSGLSLFYFYFGQYYKHKESYQLGKHTILKSLSYISNGYNNLSFCYGIAGYGWTIDHLSQRGFIDVNSDEFLPSFDNAIFDEMISNLNLNNYDYLHGALGQGMYFLNRYKSTQLKTLYIRYRQFLTRLVAELLRISEETESELKWYTFLDEGAEDEKIYNLSLSHGQASIVNFLSRLLILDDYFLKLVEQPLRKSLAFLKKHQNTGGIGSSLFPNWILPGADIDYNSRLSWCYGDLGIATSLWNAAFVLNDQDLKKRVIEIFRFNANRKNLNKCGIVDAGVCHGSFGIAKMYNYIYENTNDQQFLATRDYWVKIGLSQGENNEINSGYKKWVGTNRENPWQHDINLLEGISGIGLNLIDLMAKNNKWDECLLLNL
ncbi:lanthionine synthetase C family protein [Gelidibacter sp. F2691]|nr:lanthionine synthetase C family protein [Gelidibacter sp. F2691]